MVGMSWSALTKKPSTKVAVAPESAYAPLAADLNMRPRPARPAIGANM